MIKKSLNHLLSFSKSSIAVSNSQFYSSNLIVGYKSLYNFSKITVKVPSMGDSITEGTTLEIKKNIGESVKADEPVVVLETDKVQVEVRAPEAGVITQIFTKLQDVIEVGKPAFELDNSGAALSSSSDSPKETPKKEETLKKEEAPKPQQATAPQQNVAPKDTKPTPKTPEINLASAPLQVPGQRTEKREPMSKMRQVIAKRMKESQNTNALLTTFQEVDMSYVMDTRKELADEFAKKHNVKLGFMSFFLRAACQALKDQPIVNAVISSDGKEIIYRNYIDISVAVATPTGLLVPVIRNVENLSFAGIEKTLAELGARGKAGKITPEELSGGTFTVSNGGVFGSLMGTPIVNMPQSAILGMHAVVNRPVVVKDQIVARPMMYLALTYDHRIIDGKDGVTFLKKIKTSIEPARTCR